MLQPKMTKNVNIIARIALFSISPLPYISFLRIFVVDLTLREDFRNRIVSAWIERMALHESFEGKPDPLHHSETLD
jgi:hypothetical protein